MEDNRMTDLEYDLRLNIELASAQWEDFEVEIDCEETAKNLSKMGYQKIVWHDAKKELPKLNKAYSEYVLGYDCCQDYAVVSWDGTDWADENGICYDITHWAELPNFDYGSKNK